MKHYPESPEVSSELTKLPFTYYLKALLAVFSVILFFLLYCLMIYGFVQLVILAISYPMGYINKLTILGKVGAVAGSIMLLIFALKFILKLKNHKPNNRIELSKTEYPKLWDFILEICKETSAPKPKYIYVDPDVNAYVKYTNTWLSLFLPVKKELTIGLGLVSTLNLSEFKAVMSHEFGHFSQKSMTIGSYIMSANTIIHDMIFSRDKWDDTLESWKRQDFRISFIAWLLTPIIWLIRQFLNLFYQLLNLMYSLLSREMEFNADKVAVKTSGSDAIVSGLWKLEKGFENWNSTINNIYFASQSDKYISNIYSHLDFSWDNMKPIFVDEKSKMPYHTNGGLHFFSSAQETKIDMYASHPPNNLREQNAKSPYIKCKMNEDSPWCLFDNKEILQEKMTLLLYKIYFDKEPKEHISFENFQSFIELEKKNSTLFEEYGNSFNIRFLNIPDSNSLKEKAIIIGVRDDEYFNNLIQENKTLNEPVLEHEGKMKQVNDWFDGVIKLKNIEYKGVKYKKKELNIVYHKMQKDLEQLFSATFNDWDISFFASHFALAKSQNQDSEYLKLVNQQALLEKFNRTIIFNKTIIIERLNDLQTQQEVSEGDITELKSSIDYYITVLNNALEKEFNEENFVPIPNIENLSELKKSLVEGGEYKHGNGDIFNNGHFDIIMHTLEQSSGLCNRVSKKNLEQILIFNKRLVDQV